MIYNTATHPIKPESPKTLSKNKTAAGIKTRATIKDFIAYNGDTPPWD